MHINSTLSGLLCSAVLLIGIPAAQAESTACKGMEQAACTESGNCRWINSYKRADGREIKGYCRTLPSKDVKDMSGAAETKGTQPQKS